MNLYSKIKKEHLFIFIVILVALIFFNYFNFGYTGLAVKNTCYGEGYSCCASGTGQGDYYFSLDDTCNTNEQCWSSCKVDENLITTRVTLVDAFQEFFDKIKSFFTRPVAGFTCSGTPQVSCDAFTGQPTTCNSIRGCSVSSVISGVSICGGTILDCEQQNNNYCSRIRGCSLTGGPICGDGIIDTGEQCDDGNTVNGDGCSSTCQLGYKCIGTPTVSCSTFTGQPTTCNNIVGCSYSPVAGAGSFSMCTGTISDCEQQSNNYCGQISGCSLEEVKKDGIPLPEEDTTPPEIAVLLSTQNPIVNQQFTITATASDPGGISEIKIYEEDILIESCSTSPCTTRPLAFSKPTSRTYYAEAKDNSPNKNIGRDPETGTKSFTVSQPTTTTVSCSSGQKIGDVNGDGQITSYDASLASQIASGLISQPSDICCVDVNKDEFVNSADASQILQIAVGNLQSPGQCGQEVIETLNAPYNLVAEALSSTQIRVTWRYDPSNEIGFKIEKSQTSPTSGFTEIGTVPRTRIVYQDLGLTPNTQYWYRIRAYNDVRNSDYSNIVTATTHAEEVTLNPPRNLEVNLVNIGAQLTWDVSSSIITSEAVLNNQITGNAIKDVFNNILDFFKRLFRGEIVGISPGQGYKIYRVDDLNQETVIELLEEEAERFCTSSKCTYIDRTVIQGQNRIYSYGVSAVSRTGESQRTNQVSIGPPSDLSIIINALDGNEQKTNSKDVNLKLSAKNAYRCRYSNDEQKINTANYENYIETKSWELTSTGGIKNVYYQCTNLLGTSSKISDTIEFVSTITCTSGSLKSGTQCLVCNTQGTAYTRDNSKCSTGQVCGGDGKCLPSTVSCSTGQKIGDINNDTIINNVDAEIALNINVGIIPKPSNVCCVDVNKDANVDAFDASLISQIEAGTYTVQEPSVCIEIQKEICNNDKDDDNDNIIDGLDRDCALGAKVTLDRADVSDDEPFEDSEITLECTYSTSGPTATPGRGAACISGKINDADCEFEDRDNNIITYTCETGAEEEDVEVGCYISQNCNTDTLDNKKINLINVVRPALCSEIIGEDILEISSQDINDDEFKIGEVIESDLRIANDDEDDKDIVVEALLYDLKDKELIEEATLTKKVRAGRSENFELKITIPSVAESIFRMYYKIYEDNNEDEFCIESFEKLEIKGVKKDVCDKDNDGEDSISCGGQDCNDNDALVNPDAVEICTDNKDNDCNNLIDSQDPSCLAGACTTGETRECGIDVGECRKGIQSCVNGAWGNCAGAIFPSTEICTDNLDNDCDNNIDASDSDCAIGDSDNDGLQDSWELANFGDLAQNADDDFDGDGFSNLEEFSANTDPTNPDDKPEKANILVPILIVLGILIIAFVLVWFFALRPKKPKPTEIKFKPTQPAKPTQFTQVTKKPNPALAQYIKSSLKKGFTKQQIKNALSLKGWTEREIEEAFKYK